MDKTKFAGSLIKSLMALFVCLFAFGAIKAGADEEVPPPAPRTVSYVALTNKITGDENTVLYVLKTEKNNKIKTKAKSYVIDESREIGLADMGIKSTNKDVYIYACDKAFEAEATNISANLVIKAQAAKKVTGKIDYTQADYPESDEVLSISAIGTDGNEIKEPVCVWCETVDGEYKTSNLFNAAKLNEMLANGGGAIFVKMRGTDTPARFSSKAIKVKIAKPAGAPKVKIDPARDSIALKNGYDFSIALKDREDNWYTLDWCTVLPYLKTAKIKTKERTIVWTECYKPVDKKSSEAREDNGEKVSYSSYKIKGIPLSEIIYTYFDIDDSEDIGIAVRKSATKDKPASMIQYIELEGQTRYPIVFTESNVYGQFKVASTDDFMKKGILSKNIKNFNATGGYDDTFKVYSSQDEIFDNNPEAYEFCVVNKNDLQIIDWSSFAWKKFTPGKTKINGKLKTKYNTSEKIGVEAVLTCGNAPQEYLSSGSDLEVPSTVSTLLLIRRKGLKGSVTVRPSRYIKLFVVKEGNEYVLYSTRSVGDRAYRYTINFYTFKENADGSSGEFVKDGSIESITGWQSNYLTKKVKFPDLIDGEYRIGSVSEGKLVPTEKVELDENGNYEISSLSEDTEIKIVVGKYAKNITVKAVFGTKENDKFTPIEAEPQTLGFVINGVHSGLNGETPVTGGGNPEVFIGTPFSAGGGKLGRPQAPSGYKLVNNGTEIAAKGKGYCNASYTGGTITYTPLQADSTEIVIYVTVEPENN